MSREALKPFVCLQCGLRFKEKRAPGMTPSLSKHWAATGHGPDKTQQAGIERAMENVVPFRKRGSGPD